MIKKNWRDDRSQQETNKESHSTVCSVENDWFRMSGCIKDTASQNKGRNHQKAGNGEQDIFK